MQVTFYNNKSESIVINKELEEAKQLTDVSLKGDCSMLNPVLTISKISFENLFNCNYCYIPNFGRYYYINNIVLLKGGMVEVQCSVDVLMSWKNQFLQCDAILSRHESIFNAYLTDNEYLVNNQTNFTFKQFPIGLQGQTLYFYTI